MHEYLAPTMTDIAIIFGLHLYFGRPDSFNSHPILVRAGDFSPNGKYFTFNLSTKSLSSYGPYGMVAVKVPSNSQKSNAFASKSNFNFFKNAGFNVEKATVLDEFPLN